MPMPSKTIICPNCGARTDKDQDCCTFCNCKIISRFKPIKKTTTPVVKQKVTSIAPITESNSPSEASKNLVKKSVEHIEKSAIPRNANGTFQKKAPPSDKIKPSYPLQNISITEAAQENIEKKHLDNRQFISDNSKNPSLSLEGTIGDESLDKNEESVPKDVGSKKVKEYASDIDTISPPHYINSPDAFSKQNNSVQDIVKPNGIRIIDDTQEITTKKSETSINRGYHPPIVIKEPSAINSINPSSLSYNSHITEDGIDLSYYEDTPLLHNDQVKVSHKALYKKIVFGIAIFLLSNTLLIYIFID